MWFHVFDFMWFAVTPLTCVVALHSIETLAYELYATFKPEKAK